MSFLATVRTAREILRTEKRLSVRAVQRELGCDDETMTDLLSELLDVQSVAVRQGSALVWAEDAGSAPAEAGERRQLSVLFCDVVGSTSMASQLDVEDWRDLLCTYQELAHAAIERFGGYVAQFLGDGILAYFGYPTSYEDDAERAVRAGLGIVDGLERLEPELYERHGERLRVRIGIHTGSVVLGEVGSGEARETLALGGTTHVAARLQHRAHPNQVVISEATARLTSGIFATEALGALELPGITEPMRAFRAVHVAGMRSRIDGGTGRTLSPLTGREEELDALRADFAGLRDGHGRAVFISGEAGIGKSRLLRAFRESLCEEPHSWLEVHGSAHDQNSAFFPVLAAQRDGLAFQATDDTEIKLDALRKGLSIMDFDVEETLPLLAYFHGIPVEESNLPFDGSGEGARARLLELFSEWLIRLAKRQPVVIVIEDLHWLDPSTLETMGRVLARLHDVPVLLVATYRTAFDMPWESPGAARTIELTRLERGESRSLAASASAGRLPDRWLDQIVDRADGVPLFVEELVRAVVDGPDRAAPAQERPDRTAQVQELPRIPETLQDLLEARLDALGPAKSLVQLSAVLGREFSREQIVAAAGGDPTQVVEELEEVLDADVFYRRGRGPDATYVFRHALIRDAAYQSLVRSARRALHLKVAEAFLERLPQLTAERPEVVAYHLTEAGEHTWAHAYWMQSARQHAARSAHREAIGQLHHGLECLANADEPGQEERELALQLALGVSLQAIEGFSSPSVRATYERARALCDLVRDPVTLAAGLWGSVVFHVTTGELGEAAVLARRLGAVESIRSTPRTASEYALGNVAFLEGRFEDALAHSRAALESYNPAEHEEQVALWGHDMRAMTCAYLGWVLWPLGFFEESRRCAEEAVAHARAIEHPFTLAFALTFAGAMAKLRGERDRAREIANETLELAERHGFTLWQGTSLILKGWCDAGRPGALETTQRGIAIAASTQNQTASPLILSLLAEVTRAAGLPDEALGVVDLALATAQQFGMHFWDAELLGLRGELCAELGDHEEAAASLRQGLDVAIAQRAAGLVTRARHRCARVSKR